jgi:hypothetical protein
MNWLCQEVNAYLPTFKKGMEKINYYFYNNRTIEIDEVVTADLLIDVRKTINKAHMTFQDSEQCKTGQRNTELAYSMFDIK